MVKIFRPPQDCSTTDTLFLVCLGMESMEYSFETWVQQKF